MSYTDMHDRNDRPGCPQPPGGPEHWQRVLERVRNLYTVLHYCTQYTFWRYRARLTAEVGLLAREATFDLGYDEDERVLDDYGAWAEYLALVEDVVVLERTLRDCRYQQCASPFVFALERLYAATMLPENHEGECPFCGATHFQRQVAPTQPGTSAHGRPA